MASGQFHPYNGVMDDMNTYYNALTQLVEDRTGLVVRPSTTDALNGLLRRVAVDGLPAYLDQLRRESVASPHWQALIDALTISETYFFRDSEQFNTLRQRLLPDLIVRRRANNDLRLNLWSAGCATGEEAYSLAMTLLDLLPDIDNWHITLIGTDINERALNHARRGVYRAWAFRRVDDTLRARYFRRDADGVEHIAPTVRAMVTFHRANLLDAAPPIKFDVVLCRNVLLYLSERHTREAETTLANALAQDGLLVLGQSEVGRVDADRWRPVDDSGLAIYLTVAAPTAPDTPPLSLKKTPCPHLADALTALHDDRLNDAAGLLDACDGDPQADVLRAYVHAGRQQTDAAHRLLDRVLNADTLNADAHYLRAVLHMEAGGLEAALESLRACLYARPTDALAAFTLGNLHAQLDNPAAARRNWHRAQRALLDAPPDAPVSDLSDLTAADLRDRVNAQLARAPGVL